MVVVVGNKNALVVAHDGNEARAVALSTEHVRRRCANDFLAAYMHYTT